MSTQSGFNFDRPAAILAKEKGMRRVENHANPAWIAVFYEAIKTCARRMPEFTADDVFLELQRDKGAPETHQHRAAGPVIKRAQRDGVIELTDRTRTSARRSCHNTTIRVYRSLICRN